MVKNTKTLEHATNLSGTSVILNGVSTSFYAQPLTVLDYFGMYAYPLSFIGAMFFTVIQIVDVSFPSTFFHKNVVIIINVCFILWSLIAMSVYYNFLPTSIPWIGPVFGYRIPYLLPFNTQSVIVQG
jgi:hypothetical protein